MVANRVIPINLEISERELALASLADPEPRRMQRAAILLLASYGFSYRGVAEAVSCDRDTARRITDLFREIGDLGYVMDSASGGRPRKTSKIAIRSAGILRSKANPLERDRSRAARKLGVSESTISRELRRESEPSKLSRQPKHLSWDAAKRSPFVGSIRREWQAAPFVNHPSAEDLGDATRQVIDSIHRGWSEDWATWRKLRQLTKKSGLHEIDQIMTDEPTLWQDMAIILTECWLVPPHPAYQLWREPPGGDLADSYTLLKKGRLLSDHGNWPLIRDYIDDDPLQIAAVLEIDPAKFAGAAIRHWEKTYVNCFTALATWLTDIGIAKSMEEMPKTISPKTIRSKKRQRAENKARKRAIEQEFARVAKEGATESDVSETGAEGNRPAPLPPQPWCWDPFAEQHSPLAPPEIFREFMIRYGHLAET